MALNFNTLDDLYAQIKQYVPSCPPNQIKLQLSRSVRDFFIKTEVWVARNSIGIEVGTTVYDLDFNSSVFVNKIYSAYIDNYDVLDEIELIDNVTIEVSSDFATNYDGYSVDVQSILSPFDLPCDIPSRMVNRYSDFFIAGAVMNITGIPSKLYTDPALEAKMAVKWQQGLDRAEIDSVTGNKRKVQVWGG